MDSSAASPSDLKGEEEKGFYNPEGDAAASVAGLKDREEAADSEPDDEGGLWQQPDKTKRRGRFRISRRNVAIGGTIAGLVVGGGAFFFTALEGVLEPIHWSEMLQKNFSKSENASADRTRKLYRFSPFAQDNGETRLTVKGRLYLRRTVTQLESIGIEYNKNSLDGLKSVSVDIDKLSEKYPELKDMSRSEQKVWLAKQFDGIPIDSIGYENGKFYVGGKDFSLKTTAILKKQSIALLDYGKIPTALKNRTLAKYLDIPGLLHPIQRKAAEAVHSGLNKAELDAERQRQAALTEGVEAKGDAATKHIEDESSKYNSVIMKSLMFTGSACFVKSVSGDIVTVNRTRVVLPATIKALDLIALGAQAKSGKDISMKQVSAAMKALRGTSGKSLGQSKAMQATEGKSNPTGTDVPEDLKQAFMPNATAAAMESGANHVLGGAFLAGLGCSGIGQTVQLVAGLSASAISAFGEVASAGTLTPGIVAIWTAKEGASFAISAVAMHYIGQYIVDKNTAAKLTEEAFSGPGGLSLLAWGARAGANMGSIAEGGIELAGTASGSLVDSDAGDQEFASKSALAKVFDVKDYRSLSGRMLDSLSPSVSQNASNVVASLAHVGNVFGSLFSTTMMPKAAADAQPYQWGMPQYGIPSEILNDPNFANPYDNAEKVAALMDGDSGGSYRDRAKACFGVDINKDSGVWNVSPQNDVNPADSSYTDAHCSDISDYNWRRLILFVFDTRTMASVACYMGDDESCQDVTGSVTPPAAPADDGGDSPTDSTDAKNLAKQMLENSNITYWTNNGVNTRDVVTRIAETGKGFTTSNDAYAVAHRQVDVNPAVLQFILDLAQSHKVMVNALTDKDHSPESNHYKGIAVDLDCGSDVNKALLDSTASKYGGKNNGEVCPGDAHWHYDFPKN